MTQGKSLVEDMARAIRQHLAEKTGFVTDYGDEGTVAAYYGGHWVTLSTTGLATAALSALKDRLPADDRELVERLRAVCRTDGTLMLLAGDLVNPNGPEAADRIIAYSASRDDHEEWEQWMRDQEARARSESKS